MAAVGDILCVGREGGVVRSVRGSGLLLVSTLVFACSPAAAPASRPAPPLEIPRLDGGTAHRADERGGVRFSRIAPTVGSRSRVSVEARSAIPDAQGGTQRSEYTSVYTVEVLATSGPAPSRLRLTFETNVHRYQGAEKPTSIDGQTYVVDVAQPHVRVGDASGAPAAEEPAQRVLDIVPDLGTRAQIDQVLPDTAMAIGDARDALAAAILRVIHPRAWSLDNGTAVLSRADAEEAVFRITITASSQTGLRLSVEGEARVRLRDARLTSIVVHGAYAHAGGVDDPGSFTLERIVRDL